MIRNGDIITFPFLTQRNYSMEIAGLLFVRRLFGPYEPFKEGMQGIKIGCKLLQVCGEGFAYTPQFVVLFDIVSVSPDYLFVRVCHGKKRYSGMPSVAHFLPYDIA